MTFSGQKILGEYWRINLFITVDPDGMLHNASRIQITFAKSLDPVLIRIQTVWYSESDYNPEFQREYFETWVIYFEKN